MSSAAATWSSVATHAAIERERMLEREEMKKGGDRWATPGHDEWQFVMLDQHGDGDEERVQSGKVGALAQGRYCRQGVDDSANWNKLRSRARLSVAFPRLELQRLYYCLPSSRASANKRRNRYLVALSWRSAPPTSSHPTPLSTGRECGAPGRPWRRW